MPITHANGYIESDYVMTATEIAMETMDAPTFTNTVKWIYDGSVVWIVENVHTRNNNAWMLYVGVMQSDGTIDPSSVIYAVDVDNWESTMWDDDDPTRAQIRHATVMFGNIIRARDGMA